MNVDIFKDATSKLTSNMIPNMRVFILVMSMSLFELTLPPLIKKYAKTWLNTVLTITLMISCFRCNIYWTFSVLSPLSSKSIAQTSLSRFIHINLIRTACTQACM